MKENSGSSSDYLVRKEKTSFLKKAVDENTCFLRHQYISLLTREREKNKILWRISNAEKFRRKMRMRLRKIQVLKN